MTTVRMVFDIDEDLRTEINIIAKRQKTTVKAIMNQLVEDFVRENKEWNFYLLYFFYKIKIGLKLSKAFANII